MVANSPSGASLLRWTYAGALDDMVVWYPWPKIRIGKKALDARLAYSVVTGTPLLLNDGYLLLNQACLEALRIENSPLRVLLDEGYVRVLSRNSSRHFDDIVREGAKQKIPSYERLVADKKELARVVKAVEPLEASLRKSGHFVGWPTHDLTSTYVGLIHHLMKLPHDQRGLRRLPERVFDAVATEFLHSMSRKPRAPRTEWERIAKAKAPSQWQIDVLMQLANEVYHLNFGIGMLAGAPAGLPPYHEIAVQTRLPTGLLSFYKIRPQVKPDSLPQPLTLPGGVDYSIGHILMPFFSPSQKAGAARQVYLAAHASFLNGGSSSAAMVKATQEYQGQINEYFLPYAPRGKRTLKGVNVVVTVGAALIGLKFTGPIAAGIIAAVAWFGTDYLAPTVMEVWRSAGKLDDFANLKLSKSLDARHALAALAVDDAAAAKLVADSAPK